MVESNNAINNTVGAKIDGVTNTLTVTNSADTVTSAARVTITVGGASAEDPTINFNVAGQTDWEMGIDNSDDDKWKLSQSTALGARETIIADTSGAVLKPRLPSFRAFLSASLPNATGDGTTVNIIFDSVDWNIGSSYDTGTGIFTAPIDGFYFFNLRMRLDGVTASHSNVTMTCNDPLFRANAANMRNAGDALAITGATMLFLNASDTVQGAIAVSGGAKVVELSNLDGTNCVFLGHLIH